MKKTIMLAAAALMMAGCGSNSNREKVPALDLSWMDTTVSPSNDFYRYAVGGWRDANPLSPEHSRFGSFDKLREDNVKRLSDLFASMATMKAKRGTVEQKISDLYKMGLDSVKLNNEGAAPIQKYIEQIYAASSKEEIVKLVAELHNCGESAFFSGEVEADLMDSGTQIFYIAQGGLGIGDRDYYTESVNAEIKKGYHSFLTKIFELSGLENAEQAADNALSVENALAESSWTNLQNRYLHAMYNPMSSDEFAKKYPGFDFATYFAARNIPPQEKLIVMQPSFFEGLSKLYAKTDIDVLKDYLAGMLISGACGALSDDFSTASFEFFDKQMSGVQEQKPRWKRASTAPDIFLGEAVGKMYVDRYFPESSKKMMLELVENLRTALGEHIDALDWMGDETKAKAQEKLAGFTVKIGYPDTWKDYSSLDIDPELSYFENLRSASRWYIADNMKELGQPTDKAEWGMSPQTVNAYYNPTTNEICFPAAILQPPFFNPNADEAVNYGGIGVVIGHEMSHGFDDQGRLFDVNGNMTDWWTEEDSRKFNEKADILVKQFDEIEILPGLMANGRFTLGENIGDHGGISIAYTAMQNALKDKNPGLIDGFTPEQRFFLSYGAIWAQNITDEAKKRLTQIDVHSLAENRVNVSLKNFHQFFDAFGIKEGDAMFRPESERVSIW